MQILQDDEGCFFVMFSKIEYKVVCCCNIIFFIVLQCLDHLVLEGAMSPNFNRRSMIPVVKLSYPAMRI